MEKILARRFAPFNFSAIPGFPNVVPSPNEWGDYLPIFGKREEDNPAQHLNEFHELMHQWEIHHEGVLLKMFMFSLAGDARKWYYSLPPARISSLSEFHAAFTAYCQKLYPSELIFHNFCEGYYNKCIQDRAVSYVGYEDDPNDLDQKLVLSPPHSSALGGVMELIKSITARLDRWEAERCAEDFPPFEEDDFGISTMDDYEDPREEEDASGGVMELIKSITARLDMWEVEQCAEDFPSFEADALSSSTEGDYEKSFPTGHVYGHYESDPWESQEEEILPDMIMFDGGCDDEGCKDRRLGEEDALSELIEQAKSLTAQHARLESEGTGEGFPVLEAHVLSSSFEEIIEDLLDALAFAPDEPVVLELNEEAIVEEYCSFFLHEISHDVFTFGIERKDRETVPFLQDGEVHEEDKEEPKEQLSAHFFSYPELVNEQPSPENSEPTLVVHSPVLIRDIQPHVSNSVEEEAACRPFSKIRHSFYDPVSEYMEWNVLYALELPYFISTSACEEKLKSVAVLLSWLHHLLVIIDRRKELLSRKLLQWLWWKSAFT